MSRTSILFILIFIFSSFIPSHTIRKAEGEKIYVSSDRYYYNPNEKIYFSAFISNMESSTIQSSKVKVWLENSRNQVLDSAILLTATPSIKGEFKLPNVGGIYYLKAITAHQKNFAKQQVFTKEIFVQSYVKQNINVRINLDKKNYDSEDSIKGFLSISEPGNKPITNTLIHYNLVKDGKAIIKKEVVSDIYGKANIKIKLPRISDSSKASYYLTATMQFRASDYSASERVITEKRKAVVYLHYAHGNTGYLAGEKNRVVLKTTDKYGNPMDIKAQLINSTNSKKVAFKSLKNGLGSFQFTPKAQTKYFLIRDKDTLIELNKAEFPVGLSCIQEKGQFSANLIGDLGYRDFKWTITHNGEVLVDLPITQISNYQLNTKEMTGVLSIQITDNDFNSKPIVQKVFFLGREDLKSAKIELKDSVFMLGKLKEIGIQHLNNQKAHFSVSIIEESNINQIEDKSHNVVSWLYLGSEFKKEIEEPQFYFDNSKKLSATCLELLMHTLSPYWIRDYNSGKVIGNPDFEFVSTSTINGNVRCASNYYINDKSNCNQVSVGIKNTSIKTLTDKTGAFKLNIPSYFQGEVTLVIKKDLEKIEYVISDLNQVVSLKEGFYEVKEIPKKIIDTVSLFAELEPKEQQMVNQPLNKKNLKTKVIVEKKKVAQFRLNQLAFGENGGAGKMEANAIKRVTLAGRVDGVSLDNAFYLGSTSDATAAFMPNSFLWDFNGDFVGTYSVAIDGEKYRQPFYVSVTRNYKRVNPHPEKNKSTAFWKPFVETNLKGKALVKLAGQLAAGGFLVLIEGIDAAGKPFWAKKFIEVKDRFAVEASIPDQLYVGDQSLVTVSITNNQKKESLVLVKSAIGQKVKLDSVYVKAKQTLLYPIPLGSLSQIEQLPVSIQLQSDKFNWNLSKQVKVNNYHIQETEIIGGDSTNSKTVDLSNAEMSSVSMQMDIFPSLSKQILQIAEGLIRQPNGCFEQVSSSNYPNIMALMLMQQSNQRNSALQSKAKNFIAQGYTKLVSYETPQSGFEWFGNNPPHEALTAYGLLQFHLMKKVGLQVEAKMFNRNLNWLWKRRDDKGGFQFHKGKYDRFSRGNYEVNNAYITYVLSRVSDKNIDPQIEAMKRDLKKGFDGYKMALLINILQNRGQQTLAMEYYGKLKKHILKSYFKEIDTRQSIVCNRGKPLDLEVIAITLMAAVEAKDFAFGSQLRSAILESTNGRGYFGSTQATALSLEALTMLSGKESAAEQSTYQVFINNKLVKSIQNGSAMKYDIPKSALKAGKNKIEIRTNGRVKAYNYTLTWVEKRQSKLHKQMPFSVTYSKDSLKVAEFCEMKVFVKNKSKIQLGQVVATLNIPSALAVSTQELRQLTRMRKVSYYEIIGNKLNLYFLGLDPGQEKTISLNLKANLRGVYHSASHEVFEYYQPEVVSKFVSNPIVIK